MRSAIYSTADKLQVVERIIVETRSSDEAAVLKEIAADLRASQSGKNRVANALAYHIDAALRTKARTGYIEVGHYQAIATGLIAHWPVVRRALEELKIER